MNPQEVDQMLMSIIQSMDVNEKMQLLNMLLPQQDNALAEAFSGAR